MKKGAKVPHPEFARRMEQACDGNSEVPPPNYGRLGWFEDQILERFGERITKETVRKWFAGESRPRHRMMSYLAQILKVDEAWLSIGKAPEITEKQRRIRDASADGAVNVVAGFVQMSGGHPAFPREDDARAIENKIDLYAIIRGAQYAFHVVTGQRTDDGWVASVPVDARETVVIAVLPMENLHPQFFELDWDGIEERGRRKGAVYEVSISASEPEWRQIKTFSERL